MVSSVASTLTPGSTGNAISGTNFNGFDLGGAYGDDAQAATNFPLVRITNNSTGDVCFARSYNFSTMGVWTTGTTNATFDVPASCETGASELQVIVNGIASADVDVILQTRFHRQCNSPPLVPPLAIRKLETLPTDDFMGGETRPCFFLQW